MRENAAQQHQQQSDVGILLLQHTYVVRPPKLLRVLVLTTSRSRKKRRSAQVAPLCRLRAVTLRVLKQTRPQNSVGKRNGSSFRAAAQ
jgi:hypothetical protein